MPTQAAAEYDLGPAGAAEILGVDRDTVARWADAGKLHCWRTPTGYRRFRRADVEALLPKIEELDEAAS